MAQNTGNTGNAAGNTASEGIKGWVPPSQAPAVAEEWQAWHNRITPLSTTNSIFNTAHGIGESIRGNFNNFVDQAGEGLSSNMGTKEEQAARQSKLGDDKLNENASIAQKGEAEVTKGINQLTGNSGNNASGAAASDATR